MGYVTGTPESFSSEPQDAVGDDVVAEHTGHLIVNFKVELVVLRLFVLQA
jgi:hypothetical protein